VPDTPELLEGIISELENPPILIGDSLGGALDRGLGAAGITIDSVPTEGMRALPASQLRANFPALHNPANRHRAVGFMAKKFHYAFTNTLSKVDSAAVYERYHIPAPRPLGVGRRDGNMTPGHQATWRGPLRALKRPHRLQRVPGARPRHRGRGWMGRGR
jgi:hypothetical protein